MELRSVVAGERADHQPEPGVRVLTNKLQGTLKARIVSSQMSSVAVLRSAYLLTVRNRNSLLGRLIQIDGTDSTAKAQSLYALCNQTQQIELSAAETWFSLLPANLMLIKLLAVSSGRCKLIRDSGCHKTSFVAACDLGQQCDFLGLKLLIT